MPHPAPQQLLQTCRWHSRLLTAVLTATLATCAIAAERPPVGVIVAAVKSLQLADAIEALGTSSANEAIVLTPKITEKITKIHFTDGQKVVRDQLLVQLNDQEEQANLRSEQAILAERKSVLRRAEELFKRKVGSEAELDLAEARVHQTEADIEAIRTRIQAHRLTAPFDGVIGLREVSEGALVEPDDVLTTLDDLSIIKVDFNVPVIHLSQLTTGLKVTATTSAYPGRTFYGELKSISSRIDPTTRTVKARAWFANNEALLLPGLLMQLELLARPRNGLTVPESAVFAVGRKHYLFTVEKAPTDQSVTTALQREIAIGVRTIGVVEILSGVQEGDLVISHGNLKVTSGSKVRIIAVDDGKLDIASVLNNDQKAKTP
jgi:membrane fusion protein (multidrug efflux system)